MAKIDKDVAQAFCECIELKTSNTIVTPYGKEVLLWGSTIAYEDGRGRIVVDHCGYVTRTTMNRLHAILWQYTDGVVGCGIKNGEAELRYSNGTVVPFTKAVTIDFKGVTHGL